MITAVLVPATKLIEYMCYTSKLDSKSVKDISKWHIKTKVMVRSVYMFLQTYISQ